MHLTQYLIFEICTECNLGDDHARCPNKHSDRYANLPHDTPMSDDQIVEIATALYLEHGFRGHIGFHYYNEPLMAAERMWRLMSRIVRVLPEASFTLWTNGTLLPGNPYSMFGLFDEIHVTDYGLRALPVRNLHALREYVSPGRLHIQRGRLDDRLHAIGEKVTTTASCNRMFTEFIVDYYGNVHLCCYDWQGLGSPGNIHTETLEELVGNWQWIRTWLTCPASVTPGGPPSCRRCKVRSAHIPEFIPEIAADAKQSLEDR